MNKKKMKLAAPLAIVTSFFILLYYVNNHFLIFSYNKKPLSVSDGSTFSVMSFNINAYDSAMLTDNLRDGLIHLIEQERPDILCLQELSFKNSARLEPQLDSIYGKCEGLAAEHKKWRFRFYSHFPMRKFNWYKCIGDIDMSDMADKEKYEVNVYQNQMNTMSAEFEVEPNKWVKLFSGHLRSSAYSTARRSMDNEASWFDGLSLYKRNYEIGKRIRDYEAENVRKLIDARSTSSGTGSSKIPVIITGDLNDWCGSDCLNTLMGDDLKDAWWEGGNGFGWTYFGWHLRLRLDHILYSDELELVDVKVIDSNLSDHKPLMAKFRFRN